MGIHKTIDELHIHCKVRYGAKKTIISGSLPLISTKEGNLVSRFEHLFKEGMPLSDVVIDVDGTKFSAHKIVLAAGSSVFLSMFQSNGFIESETNIIKIDDLEPPVVYEMLRFLYSDRIENANRFARGLLIAADKYLIDPLKTKCEAFLAEKLTLGNCCELLTLGDSFSAAPLKNVAMEFILQNTCQVSATEGWKEMKKSAPHLGFHISETLMSRSRVEAQPSSIPDVSQPRQ